MIESRIKQEVEALRKHRAERLAMGTSLAEFEEALRIEINGQDEADEVVTTKQTYVVEE